MHAVLVLRRLSFQNSCTFKIFRFWNFFFHFVSKFKFVNVVIFICGNELSLCKL